MSNIMIVLFLKGCVGLIVGDSKTEEVAGLTKRKKNGPVLITNGQEEDRIIPERVRWSNYRRFRNRKSHENEKKEQGTRYHR